MSLSREQERERKRVYRAKRRAKGAAEIQSAVPLRSIHPTAPDAPAPEIPGPGEFERKVMAELDGLGSTSAELMPGQAGNAIAMARILDNPAAIMQHAGASGQLRAALLAMHEAARAGNRSTGKVRALRSRHVG